MNFFKFAMTDPVTSPLLIELLSLGCTPDEGRMFIELEWLDPPLFLNLAFKL